MKKQVTTRSTSDKVKSFAEIFKITAAARHANKIVVTTNGCFDVLHPGHVQTLEWAAEQGDILIVGIDADSAVRANKGPNRPIVTARDRARLIAGLACVSCVFIFKSKNPIPWLKKIKPDIHVKGQGSERDPRLAPEEKVIRAGGGKLAFAPKLKGRSTTSIVETVLARYNKNQR